MRQEVMRSIRTALVIAAIGSFSCGFTPGAVRTARNQNAALGGAFNAPVSIRRLKESSCCVSTNQHDNNDSFQHSVTIRRQGRFVTLRKRCQTIASAAIVALATQRIGLRPVYASTVSSVSTAAPAADVMVDVLEEAIIEESLQSPSEPSTAATTGTPQVTLSPQDFEKLRNRDSALSSSPSAQKLQAASAAVPVKRQKHVEVRNRSRSGTFGQTATSKFIQRAFPVGLGGFFIVQAVRMKIRFDREQAYVQDNIEKMEMQKAEYFNVTGKALSDDDLMESLAKATGNITLDDVDDDDDEEDDDEGESVKGPPATPKSPKTPSSGGGAKGSSGGDSKGKGGASLSSESPSSDSERASDDDIERMKRMFKK